jgi:hypothetical protein
MVGRPETEPPSSNSAAQALEQPHRQIELQILG